LDVSFICIDLLFVARIVCSDVQLHASILLRINHPG
jgi:hypothetical protein